MTGEEVLAWVRRDLAAAAADDASRRVRCKVCQAMTRDPDHHAEIHATPRGDLKGDTDGP